MPTPRRPKRMFKGQERASRYEIDRQPKARMDKMAREHDDVLQNIEFILVEAHRDDPAIDDLHADAALNAVLNGEIPADPLAAGMADELRSIREVRADVPDLTWLECIKVVRQSVRRHSTLRPRETTYLDFAGRFIE